MSILFSYPFFESIEKELLSSFTKGEFSQRRFSNQELYQVINASVSGKSCFLLGSISPPDENLFSYLVLSHTLKKEGAKECVGLLPYLAYTRHENPEPGKSLITGLIGNLFLSAGLDRVITVDVHDNEAKKLFPIPLVSLSPAKIFADRLRKISFMPDVIIAPDEGAFRRAKDVAVALERNIAVIPMYKKREEGAIVHEDFKERVGKKLLIVDDILDTGETLLSAVSKVASLGAQEIIIMVSHGLFTGNLWKELWKFNVKRIYCTDTIIPTHSEIGKYPIHFLSVGSLFEEFLCKQ